MKKPLKIYQGQMQALSRERRKLDEDFGQVIAEALRDGYKIHDILDLPINKPEYDL